MYDHEKLYKRMKKMNELTKKKAYKSFDMIFSEEFTQWITGTSENQPVNAPMVDRLYSVMVTPLCMKALYKYLSEGGYSSDTVFTRANVKFIVDMVNVSNKVLNDELGSVSDKLTHEEISVSAYNKFKDIGESYGDISKGILDSIRKITINKMNLKELAKNAGVHKNVLYQCVLVVPDPETLDRSKIGKYVNSVLTILYGETARGGYLSNNYRVKWVEFFEAVFTRRHTASVAVSILLEGTRKMEMYDENPQDVKRVWDELSQYALDLLNNCPEGLRGQMIELYIKRASRVQEMAKGPVSLRVNLTNIPDEFSNLVRTVGKYLDKLSNLYGNSSNTNNSNQERPTQNNHKYESQAYSERRRDNNSNYDNRNNKSDNQQQNQPNRNNKGKQVDFSRVNDLTSQEIQNMIDEFTPDALKQMDPYYQNDDDNNDGVVHIPELQSEDEGVFANVNVED